MPDSANSTISSMSFSKDGIFGQTSSTLVGKLRAGEVHIKNGLYSKKVLRWYGRFPQATIAFWTSKLSKTWHAFNWLLLLFFKAVILKLLFPPSSYCTITPRKQPFLLLHSKQEYQIFPPRTLLLSRPISHLYWLHTGLLSPSLRTFWSPPLMAPLNTRCLAQACIFSPLIPPTQQILKSFPDYLAFQALSVRRNKAAFHSAAKSHFTTHLSNRSVALHIPDQIPFS